MPMNDTLMMTVCYFFLSLAYVMDRMTKVEYLLSILILFVVYVALLLCRIHSTAKEIQKNLKDEKDNVQ